MANFLFLWAANAAGAAELVLVNSFMGPPSATAQGPLANQMTTIAYVYVAMMVGYASFVLLLSVFTVNVAALRVVEDAALLSLLGLACYTVVLDHTYNKEGQFLLVDDRGSVESCKSRFLSYFPLDHLCRAVVAACHDHAPDTFRFGEEPSSKLGRWLTWATSIVFKAVALWYEHRMALR